MLTIPTRVRWITWPGMSSGWMGLLALVLGACTTAPPTESPAEAAVRPNPSAPRAPVRPPPEPMLAQEARWLRDWFDGTPVQVSTPADGSLQVWVPQPHAFFEPAQADPLKPGLKAVLDRVAQSLQRQPRSRLEVQAATPTVRAEAVRQHLSARGVSAARVSAQVQAGLAGVRLNLRPGVQAIRELRDEQLPRPQPGTVRPGREPAALRRPAG